MGSKAGTRSDFVEVRKWEKEPEMVEKCEGRESLEVFVASMRV